MNRGITSLPSEDRNRFSIRNLVSLPCTRRGHGSESQLSQTYTVGREMQGSFILKHMNYINKEGLRRYERAYHAFNRTRPCCTAEQIRLYAKLVTRRGSMEVPRPSMPATLLREKRPCYVSTKLFSLYTRTQQQSVASTVHCSTTFAVGSPVLQATLSRE